jgi:type I restriction enzyme S subunit
MSEESGIATFEELIRAGVLEIGDGYRAKLDELGGAGPVFLRAALLAMRASDFEAAERFQEHLAAKVATKLGRTGDTVVTTKGNSVGRTGYVPHDAPPFVYSPHLSYWRSVDTRRVSSGYLRYWSKSREFTSQLEALAHGTDMAPYLSLVDQRRIRITLPPIREQEEIADVLSALDDKITVNERMVDSALSLGCAHYDAAASEAAWTDLHLADAATWLSGGTPRTSEASYWNGDIPWISAASLKSPWIDRSDRQLTSLGAQCGTRLVPKGAVIVVVRGMSLKTEFRIGLTQREVAFGQDCKALIPISGLSSDVLFHAIRSRTNEILDLVDEAGHGTGRLATDRLTKMSIRVPSDPSHPVVAVLEELDEIAAARQRESRNLAELRDVLLPKLMSGEIRVRDVEKAVEDTT